ncbi:MAG: ABC transporter permease [Verrucomicrobia bacterium]|nr:ABC transporter permease [Verrucomicrobiota bacterium]
MNRRIRFGGVLLLWLIALGIFAARAPAFFSLANFTSTLQFSTLLALVTFGQTMVILSGGGGIDLSVGGIVSLSGLLIGLLIKQAVPIFIAGVAGLLSGGILGSLNGLIITRLKLLPLIVTLGTFYAYNGLALALTGGAPISGLPSSFGMLGQSAVLAIPLHTLVFVVPVFLIMTFILSQTPLGRWIYAIGGNEQACRLVGLPVDLIRLGTYTLSGMLAALAGLVADSWLLSARPNIGDNLELLSLTAVLLGGTSIFGGSGGLTGSFIAVLFFTSLQVGLQMLNINNIWQLGIVGLLLIGSVLLDRSIRIAEAL